METKAYVAFCAPASWQSLHTTAALEFTRFIANLEKSNPAHLDGYCVINFDRSNPVDRARNRMVKEALALERVTHLCLIDLDQIYPDGMLDQLLMWNADIIGPLAFFKGRLPRHHSPIAQVERDDGTCAPIEVFDEHWELKKEPVEADVVGLGGLLVTRQVFETLDYPWFLYDDSARGLLEGLSHDVPFCDAARRAGYTLNVLPSCVSGHVAEHVVYEEYWRYYRQRFEDGSFIQPQPKEESDDYMTYGREFFEKQRQHFENDGLFRNCWDVCRAIAERTGLHGGSILDYGAGNRRFEYAAHGLLGGAPSSGWDVTSYDPMPFPQSEYGALGENALDSTYDIIWCSEVLEHMHSEDEAADVIDSWRDLDPSVVVCTINLRSGRDVCPTHWLMRTRGWWIDFFEKHGWRYDKALTDVATGKDRHWLEYFVFQPQRNRPPAAGDHWDTTETVGAMQ